MGDRSLLGSRIRRLRNSRGLTLRQLADVTGLAYQYLSELERGNGNPTLGALESIAGALGCQCDVTLIAAAGKDLKPEDALFLDEIRELLPLASTEAKQAFLVLLKGNAAATRAASGQ